MRPPPTHPSLIARIQGPRNERAWGDFVAAYEPFLNRLVERQGVPCRHAPDVVQQVLAAIARSVEHWRDDGDPASFRRWLGRVARNVVIKFMTRERRQIGGQGGTDLVDLLHHVPEDVDERQRQEYEYELILWAAEEVRGEFRETSWRAFRETVIEGRTVADVASELGLSPGSIYMSRSRILARIRAKIVEVMDDVG
jgi:RNA polymerase sigma-70 factor (ECF subfamily)